MKRKATPHDFELNPELSATGVKVGDEIDIPEVDGTNLLDEEDPPPIGDDSGGNHPEKPPGKP